MPFSPPLLHRRRRRRRRRRRPRLAQRGYGGSAGVAPRSPGSRPGPGRAPEPGRSPRPAPAPAADSSSGPSSDSGPEAGSQRLLFSHDLVSGRYRGSVHFGLVRLIHGEDSDSEGEEEGRGSSGCSEAGARATRRAGPALCAAGYVRVSEHPEGRQAAREGDQGAVGRRAGAGPGSPARNRVRPLRPWAGGEACRALPGSGARTAVGPRWEDKPPRQGRSGAKSLHQPWATGPRASPRELARARLLRCRP